MATYKETVGTAVEQYAGNKPVVLEGELWYDSSAYAWKYQYANTTTASWSTGGNLNTARNYIAGAGSTQDASLAFGGFKPFTSDVTAGKRVVILVNEDFGSDKTANASCATPSNPGYLSRSLSVISFIVLFGLVLYGYSVFKKFRNIKYESINQQSFQKSWFRRVRFKYYEKNSTFRQTNT